MRAVDGYNVNVGLAELARMRMLVATHLDGHPLALGPGAAVGGVRCRFGCPSRTCR